MTEKELFREMGSIKEEYIVEAEEYRRSIIHSPIFKRTMATAACLILCIGIYWGVHSVKHYESENTADMATQSMKSTASEDTVQVEQENMPVTGLSKSDDADDTNRVEEKPTAVIQQQQTVTEHMQEAACEPETSQSTENETISGAPAVESGVIQAADKAVQSGTNNDLCKYKSELKERLTAYPNTLEALRQEPVYLILYGTVDTGQEKWDKFLQDINSSEPAGIDIVQYMDENTIIITNLCYDGQVFYVTCDNRSDLEADGHEIREDSYKYLNILETEGETEVFLSQERKLTIEDLQSGIYDIYTLFQYKKER